jgi:hypothetical protein
LAAGLPLTLALSELPVAAAEKYAKSPSSLLHSNAEGRLHWCLLEGCLGATRAVLGTCKNQVRWRDSQRSSSTLELLKRSCVSATAQPSVPSHPCEIMACDALQQLVQGGELLIVLGAKHACDSCSGQNPVGQNPAPSKANQLISGSSEIRMKRSGGPASGESAHGLRLLQIKDVPAS